MHSLAQVSPEQVFDYFDKAKKGRLSREQFLQALDKMGIVDLTGREIDVLMRSLDADGDGYVNLRELKAKLKRSGIRSRSSEEKIILALNDALQRSNMGLSDAFEIIDKEGHGVISKQDMRDVFSTLQLKQDPGEIDKFIELFWRDKDGGINYREFTRIFNRYKVQFEEEDRNERRSAEYVETEEITRLKKSIFGAMQQSLDKNGVSLRGAFEKIDSSRDNRVSVRELTSLFQSTGTKVTH